MVDKLMLSARDFSFLYCYTILSDKVKVNWCESEVTAVSTTGTKSRLKARPEACMRLRLSYIKISSVTSKRTTEGARLLRSPFGHDDGFCIPVGPHDVVNYKVHKMKGEGTAEIHILAVHSM